MEKVLYILRRYVIPKLVFRFFQPWYHRFLAFLAASRYGFPSKHLMVIGVTGTNGKSTTVEMLHQLLHEGGIRVASISSIRFKIEDTIFPNRCKMTMPGRFFIQRFMRRALDTGITHIVLEVTSEGIKQFRANHITFGAAIFTNLTPEHIEAHGGFEKYKAAKGKLFRLLKGKGISIVNLDDSASDYFLSFPAKKKIGYAAGQVTDDKKLRVMETVIPSNIELNREGIHLRFSEGWEVTAPLHGMFNAENMLAAIAAAREFGVSHEAMRRAFAKFSGIPGRMEEIKAKNFRVIVDYAFTPNALRKVYETLIAEGESIRDGNMVKTHRLICALGAAGGGRDKWKRPELGKIAAGYCHEVIVTNEDPYDEDPREIMDEVARGLRLPLQAGGGRAAFKIIEDRRDAIREALSRARSGDTVIITGKGSESSIAVAGGRQIPWDDREVVREELEKLGKI